MARKRLQYQSLSQAIFVAATVATPALCFSSFSQPAPITKTPIAVESPSVAFCVTPSLPSPTANVIFITAGSAWTIPADWNSFNNSIEVIGPGGGGFASALGAGGGAGGGYAKVTNVLYTAGNSITYAVPAGSSGSPCFINNDSNSSPVVNATGGGTATNATGATGGSGTVGSTLFNGGNGGTSTITGSGGGGGAAGLNGNGNNAPSVTTSAGNGGFGDAGFGGLFGAGGSAGGAGSPGLEWQATNVWTGAGYTGASPKGGSGGGGGAGTSGSGGNGGLYGAGGGASGSGTGGTGRQAIIVVTYTPAAVTINTGASFPQFSQPFFPTSVRAWQQPSPTFEPITFPVLTPSALAFADFDLLVRKPAIQGSFTNAPQPAFVQSYVFGQFSQPQFNRTMLLDEQSSVLFEVKQPLTITFQGFSAFDISRLSKSIREGWTNAPQVQTAVVATVTFGGFAEFDVVLHAKPIVSYDFKGFIFVQPVPVIVEAFDPFVKKRKRKAKVYDPYKEEAETKRLRRKAIEDAVYGPPVEYTLPPLVFPVDQKPAMPNLGDLPQIVLAAQQKAIVDAKLEQSKQDEDELENILKGLM